MQILLKCFLEHSLEIYEGIFLVYWQTNMPLQAIDLIPSIDNPKLGGNESRYHRSDPALNSINRKVLSIHHNWKKDLPLLPYTL